MTAHDSDIPSGMESALACAPLFGGNTVFSLVPLNGRFHFPRSPYMLTKLSATRYRDDSGRTWRTGRNVAVLVPESVP
jgi:hypothetical protein